MELALKTSGWQKGVLPHVPAIRSDECVSEKRRKKTQSERKRARAREQERKREREREREREPKWE